MPRVSGFQLAAVLLVTLQLPRAASADLPPEPPTVVRHTAPSPPPVRFAFHERVDELD